jgi:HPt (histidine-containing phosphotransfer) domain-containing protein
MSDRLNELKEELGPEILAELIDDFVNDTTKRLDLIRETITRADSSALKAAAHALKGSCGNLGAEQMQKLCERLEQIGLSGDVGGANSILAQLENEFGQIQSVFESARV